MKTPSFVNEVIGEYHDYRRPNGSKPAPKADPPKVDPWITMDRAAYYGLAGAVVEAIMPHTEADMNAILIQYLTAFGNACDRKPYFQIEGDHHYPNLFCVITGQSSKARKGTSWGRVRQIFKHADPDWAGMRVHTGLSSGEGVIHAVRDENMEGRNDDQGVSDKRLLIIEPEFSSVLAVMARQGNILSRIIRDGWDTGSLGTLTKTCPTRATGALLSIIGHITEDELRHCLDRTSLANGFANRFLFVCVKRSNCLPFGGDMSGDVIERLGNKTRIALTKANNMGRVFLSDEAKEHWEPLYRELSEGKPGLLGAVISRAEAQTIRLALVYAAIDGENHISLNHLKAGLAVWRYCEASALRIFGDALGDPVADEILRDLRLAGKDGRTRTAIRDLFSRNKGLDQIGLALSTLQARGLATHTKTYPDGLGRPTETWFATAHQ